MTFRLWACDPGPVESAWVDLLGTTLVGFGKDPTPQVRAMLPRPGATCCEMIASYGMAVGAEVFQTCVEIGRMQERQPSLVLVFRSAIKVHHCRSSRANDSNIRQAIIDRYGGKAATKKGGPLHGVRADIWQALALGLYLHDQMAQF